MTCQFGKGTEKEFMTVMKYLLGTAHALHVFLAIGPAALANRGLSQQICEAVRSGGTGSQPYNFLVLGLSLSLLGVGATMKGLQGTT